MASFTEIQTDELKSWIDDKKGQFVLVDCLPKASFDYEHLPGAINADFHASDSPWLIFWKDFLQIIKQLAPDPSTSQIVLYCSDFYCPTSGQAAKRLVSEGYQHVYKYRHGLAGWQEAQYQTEHGPNWTAE